jgi:hypothetical protein
MTDDRDPKSSEDMLREVEEWLGEGQATTDDQSSTQRSRPSAAEEPPAERVEPLPGVGRCRTCGRPTAGRECSECLGARTRPRLLGGDLPGGVPEKVTDRREAKAVILRDVGAAVSWVLMVLSFVWAARGSPWEPNSPMPGVLIGLGVLLGVLAIVAQVFSFAVEFFHRHGEPFQERWRAVRADRKRRKGYRLEDALEVFGWDRWWATVVRAVWPAAWVLWIVLT